ncbi:MAG: ABC transporter ATP-binding protein [Gammaproteobacteria bacterium]|nr:ABC transporter ATP-binding protein [Gammaproteobacteria bacterium]
MDQVIATSGLCRTFRVGDADVHALDHIDLTVDRGEFVAVMGPSGSGKTTLMNILGCLDKSDAGEYRLLDQVVSDMDDDRLSSLRNRHIGFVFQSFHLLPRMTAEENVLVPIRYADDWAEAGRRRADELLERLGLSDRMHHRPNQLSGGQRQRVAIARALVANPPLLLADEPTGNLDSATGETIMALISELNREGQTILMVTHDENVASHARRVIHMRDGKVDRDARRH